MEAMKSEIRNEMPTIADHPVLLWFKQHIRKFTGKALLQEDILETVVNQTLTDENLIGILLFGSVATKTHKWKSDIDLIFIYDNYEPASGLVNYFVSGVEVQYFYATLENLIENPSELKRLGEGAFESAKKYDINAAACLGKPRYLIDDNPTIRPRGRMPVLKQDQFLQAESLR